MEMSHIFTLLTSLTMTQAQVKIKHGIIAEEIGSISFIEAYINVSRSISYKPILNGIDKLLQAGFAMELKCNTLTPIIRNDEQREMMTRNKSKFFNTGKFATNFYDAQRICDMVRDSANKSMRFVLPDVFDKPDVDELFRLQGGSSDHVFINMGPRRVFMGPRKITFNYISYLSNYPDKTCCRYNVRKDDSIEVSRFNQSDPMCYEGIDFYTLTNQVKGCLLEAWSHVSNHTEHDAKFANWIRSSVICHQALPGVFYHIRQEDEDKIMADNAREYVERQKRIRAHKARQQKEQATSNTSPSSRSKRDAPTDSCSGYSDQWILKAAELRDRLSRTLAIAGELPKVHYPDLEHLRDEERAFLHAPYVQVATNEFWKQSFSLQQDEQAPPTTATPVVTTLIPNSTSLIYNRINSREKRFLGPLLMGLSAIKGVADIVQTISMDGDISDNTLRISDLQAKTRGTEKIIMQLQRKIDTLTVQVYEAEKTNYHLQQMNRAAQLVVDRLERSLNFLTMILSTTVEGRTSSLVIPRTVLPLLKTKLDVHHRYEIKDDYTAMKSSVVSINDDAIHIIAQIPGYSPQKYLLVKFYAIPSLKYQLIPQITYDYVALNDEETMFIPMTGFEVNQCLSKGCEQTSPGSSISKAGCGLAQYVGVPSKHCHWDPFLKNEFIDVTLHGFAFAAIKDTSVSIRCRNQKEAITIKGAGHLTLKNGCSATVHSRLNDKPEGIPIPGPADRMHLNMSDIFRTQILNISEIDSSTLRDNSYEIKLLKFGLENRKWRKITIIVLSIIFLLLLAVTIIFILTQRGPLRFYRQFGAQIAHLLTPYAEEDSNYNDQAATAPLSPTGPFPKNRVDRRREYDLENTHIRENFPMNNLEVTSPLD